MGIYTGAADFSGMVAVALAILAVGLGAWRLAFVSLTVVALIIALLLHVWSRELYRLEPVNLESWQTVSRLFRDSRLVILLIMYMFYMLTRQGFNNFLPLFFQAEKGFSLTAASASFAILFLVGAVAKPTSGWLSDRIPRLVVILSSLAFAIVILLGLVFVDSFALVAAFVAAFAVGVAGGPVRDAGVLPRLRSGWESGRRSGCDPEAALDRRSERRGSATTPTRRGRAPRSSPRTGSRARATTLDVQIVDSRWSSAKTSQSRCFAVAVSVEFASILTYRFRADLVVFRSDRRFSGTRSCDGSATVVARHRSQRSSSAFRPHSDPLSSAPDAIRVRPCPDRGEAG